MGHGSTVSVLLLASRGGWRKMKPAGMSVVAGNGRRRGDRTLEARSGF